MTEINNIVDDFAKLVNIEYSIYKQNERLNKENPKSFKEIIKERKEKMKTDCKEFLTKEINQKLDDVTNMMIKKYCNIDNTKQEKVITQKEEKEYTEEEM